MSSVTPKVTHIHRADSRYWAIDDGVTQYCSEFIRGESIATRHNNPDFVAVAETFLIEKPNNTLPS